MRLERLTLSQLEIEDEASMRGIGLYRELRRVLVRDGYKFAVAEAGHRDATWSRVLFLNLTFWGGESDVLPERRVPADVVCHVAWHHLAQRALAGAESADALFLGEAIASAFDLYLVGRLLEHVPESSFLETQIPAMSEAAIDAGLFEDDVEALLASVARDPERAFEDLRQLLFDASTALVDVPDVDAAATRLAAFSSHRFYPLLHHYELSNWLLHARARCPGRLGPDAAVRTLDARLRAAPDALALLETEWLPGDGV